MYAIRSYYGNAAALDVELGAIDGAQWLVTTKALAAELGRLPSLERCERLRGERLVNFVIVEILQRQA